MAISSEENLSAQYAKVQIIKYLKSNPTIKREELIYDLLTSLSKRKEFAVEITATKEEAAKLMNISERTFHRSYNNRKQ